LSPLLKRGGSSSFQARHPLSSPRSINLPATIAAPAPTKSQVVRRELLLRLNCTVLELSEEMRQARCRSRSCSVRSTRPATRTANDAAARSPLDAVRHPPPTRGQTVSSNRTTNVCTRAFAPPSRRLQRAASGE
jgi:hypothetical protein